MIAAKEYIVRLKKTKSGKSLKRRILLGITVALAVVAVIAVIKWKSATAQDKFKFDRAKIYKMKEK